MPKNDDKLNLFLNKATLLFNDPFISLIHGVNCAVRGADYVVHGVI